MSNEKVRFVLRYLERRFGIPPEVFQAYAFYDAGDLWILSKEAADLPIRTFKRKGLRFARYFERDRTVKLTTAAIQLFGRHAKHNVVHLTRDQMLAYVQGLDVNLGPREGVEDGQVIVMYGTDALGSGLYRAGRLKNQLPKGRRIALQVPENEEASRG